MNTEMKEMDTSNKRVTKSRINSDGIDYSMVSSFSSTTNRKRKRKKTSERKIKTNIQRLTDNISKNLICRILTEKLEKKGINIEECNIDYLLTTLNHLVSFPDYIEVENEVLYTSVNKKRKTTNTYKIKKIKNEEQKEVLLCNCGILFNDACRKNCKHCLNYLINQSLNMIISKINKKCKNNKKEMKDIDKKLNKELTNLASMFKANNTLSS